MINKLINNKQNVLFWALYFWLKIIKGKSWNFLLQSPGSGAGSGSTIWRNGSPDPDPDQNKMDPQVE